MRLAGVGGVGGFGGFGLGIIWAGIWGINGMRLAGVGLGIIRAGILGINGMTLAGVGGFGFLFTRTAITTMAIITTKARMI
tara:strand:+ start:4185 stop:4427 length:243 start_codon:yes stop_codon:yes gene_type:complete